MSNNTVVSFRQPDEIDDPLTTVLRSGARRLLAQAIEGQSGARLPGARRLASRAKAMRDGVVVSPDIEAAARC